MTREVTEREVKLIHEKSIEILETIGVKFEHRGLLMELKKHGIKIEESTVYFDRRTIESALQTLPPSFTIETPYTSLKIGEGGRAVATASGAMTILRDGEICTPTLEDFINGRKLDDTSKIVNLLCSPFIFISGLPEEEAELIKTALSLKYSKKPLIAACSSERAAAESIEFIREFYGVDSGYYTIGVENMISPLRYCREDAGAILSYIKRNQPVVIACCSTPGMTSPISIGSTIVQNNAEVLAGMVMSQLVQPGVPIVYGNVTYSSDIRRAMPISWGPEVRAFIQYAKAMADFYKVPNRIGGSLSGAKQLDWQDGAETAISLITTIDNDCDFIFHACGELDCLNVFSLEKYVLDEELLTAYLSMENRELITEDSINLDIIRHVGPGGTYLLEEETLKKYPTELFRPRLFNCENYYSWKHTGMPSVILKARKLLEERLEQHEMPRYDERQNRMLEEVLSLIE